MFEKSGGLATVGHHRGLHRDRGAAVRGGHLHLLRDLRELSDGLSATGERLDRGGLRLHDLGLALEQLHLLLEQGDRLSMATGPFDTLGDEVRRSMRQRSAWPSPAEDEARGACARSPSTSALRAAWAGG